MCLPTFAIHKRCYTPHIRISQFLMWMEHVNADALHIPIRIYMCICTASGCTAPFTIRILDMHQISSCSYNLTDWIAFIVDRARGKVISKNKVGYAVVWTNGSANYVCAGEAASGRRGYRLPYQATQVLEAYFEYFAGEWYSGWTRIYLLVYILSNSRTNACRGSCACESSTTKHVSTMRPWICISM